MKSIILFTYQIIIMIIIAFTIIDNINAKPMELLNQYDNIKNNEKFYESMINVFDTIGLNENDNDDDDFDDNDNNSDNINSSSDLSNRKSIINIKPEEKCHMPTRKGLCRALIPRWSYDSQLKDCKEFLFGGCDGNANNFRTYKQCIDICKGL